jgi:glucose-1-phosphate cytidylyltransferase
MKAVILAGGFGTRLSEETQVRPKPMVEIGEYPILWHVMKIFDAHGIHDFIVCCGYKGILIKEYFASYRLRRSDVTFDLGRDHVDMRAEKLEPWRVALVDTGDSTMTGGRLRRVRELIGDETFCFTYGDGVGDVDITELIAFHRREGRLATVTAVQPSGRFGVISVAHGQARVDQFHEKPAGDGAWINGGFFVLEPAAIDYIETDQTVWEREPLSRLARDGQLSAYRHDGFWQPMDTLRDKQVLEEYWRQGTAPWKVW